MLPDRREKKNERRTSGGCWPVEDASGCHQPREPRFAAVDEIQCLQPLRPAVLEDLDLVEPQVAGKTAAAIGDYRIDFDESRFPI